jgi:antitoxin (DNA-binding transcriptional repressor) of toxin-antitoxin stability system
VRNVSVEEFEEHTAELVAEVEAGARLTLVRGGKAVATMAPAEQLTIPDEAAREAAMARLFAIMDKGIDLQGLHIDRDELYSRD